MTLNEEKALFYLHLGYAITRWSAVEDYLGALVIGQGDEFNIATNVGYYSIDTFRTKLKYTNNIIRLGLQVHMNIQVWDLICKDLGTLAAKRNLLAHLPNRSYDDATEGKRFVLEKHDYTFRIPSVHQRIVRYGLRDIVEISNKFFAMSIRLSNFKDLIGQRPPRYDQNFETPIPAPTLRNIKQNYDRFILGEAPFP